MADWVVDWASLSAIAHTVMDRNPFARVFLFCADGMIWILALAVVGIFLCRRVRFIGKDEMLYIERVTNLEIICGPKIHIMPLVLKNWEQKRAKTLGNLDYCIIKNNMSGVTRVEAGPKLLFLEPYDHIVGNEIKQGYSLKANEFIRLLDKTAGTIRVERGPQGKVIPTPDEILVDNCGKKTALDLKCFEYVKIEDKNTGKIRVEKGEQLVFLDKYEELVGGKQKAIEIDEETAVLVRDKRTAQQYLVTDKRSFFPSHDEEILEVRKLTKLADYEGCIIRGKDGKDVYFFGKNESQRSFFVPPYSEMVKLTWSRGRRREFRDLVITKIDLRPMYMSFEFNCRTADNVELVLEGSFFWEIIDLEAMCKYTSDTSGDICNYARSKFIEKVSRVTLQEFMSDITKIAQQVHKDDNSFYTQRGVHIHSLEVSGYRCAEQSTAAVLGQIIQETTNRMNRLQQQESENEVQLFKLRGDIEEEKTIAELLTIQAENSNLRNRMEGSGEAEKLKQFLDSLEDTVPALETRIQMWQTLRKRDALEAVSGGNCKLFFTPKDCQLSIENHEHELSSQGSSGYVKVK